jgi:hypothetical protein
VIEPVLSTAIVWRDGSHSWRPNLNLEDDDKHCQWHHNQHSSHPWHEDSSMHTQCVRYIFCSVQ